MKATQEDYESGMDQRKERSRLHWKAEDAINGARMNIYEET